MRITSCQIEAFGRLTDRRFDDLDHSVLVVLGPNEAGKSTFFQFLQTMLYGIYPTDADKHEYGPRNGRRIEGSLSFRAGDDQLYRVSRKLMSTPQGQFVKPTGSTDLRNRTIPLVSHISQDVFESVYALTLYDLAALADAEAWQGIQDRLLGSLSVASIRAARVVIDELEEEATSLWRDDRRGKPASKELQERIRDLGERAREARERDTTVRKVSDQIAELEQQLQEAKQERVGLEAAKRKIDRLRPLRLRLAKIQEALDEAGDDRELDDLPDQPDRQLKEFEDEISAKRQEIEDLTLSLTKAREQAACVTAKDERLLEAAPEIRSWAKRIESYLVRKDRLEEAERAHEAIGTKLEERASAILVSDWDDAVAERIEALSRSELREGMGAFAAAQSQADEARARRSERERVAEGPRSVRTSAAAAVVVFLGALVAAFLGAYQLAASLVVVGLGLVAWTYQAKRHNDRLQRAAASDPTQGLMRNLAQRRERVAEILKGIPLPEEKLEIPDPYLVNELLSLQDVLAKQRDTEKEIRALRGALESERERARTLLERLDDQWADPGDAALAASRVELALEEAEARFDAAERATEEAAKLEKEIDRVDGELDRATRERQVLMTKLRQLGDGDENEGITVFRTRQKARRRRDSFQEDLEVDFPNLEELTAEIEELDAQGEEWNFTDEEVVEISDRLENLIDEINATSAELVAARKDLDHMLEMPTLDEIESERERLKSEVAELGQRRDRLALLAEVIRHADQRFREEHQPDVLRRAGDYLRQITGGRYERLDYDEAADTLQAFEAESDFGRVVASPLSQGTRDQIYLAVRLAIVDHLDEGQEPLPVFLDEVFVNWDAHRRNRFYDVLKQAASRRQLFIFTCHPWLAEEIQENLPARMVDVVADAVSV